MSAVDVADLPDVTSKMLPDAASMDRFAVTSCPPGSGAAVSFHGIVRDHDAGREVIELEYVAHPSAATVLRATTESVAAGHPDVETIRIAHRSGLLRVGELAFFVEVTSPHRAEAFAACSAVVDEVKERLPVWKRQVFGDATEEWVNSP